jgi:predicted dithiol-disulfide oxidoreductase (DUF899 family)
MATIKIDYPRVASRAEWLEARKAFLVQEKELTRARDRLNADRRRLPMVEVDQPYVFEGPQGKQRFVELFEGRDQLIVYHFMWLWDGDQPKESGCRNCSAWADNIAHGHLTQLHACNTTLAFISRAPFAKISAFKQRMGWQVPWYSSHGNRFNYDYHVTLDESVTPVEYNYRTRAEHERAGTAYYLDGKQPFDLHGMSCFLRKGDTVYHTYSSYGRGPEHVGGTYYFLDLTALGRQQDWEEPKGRVIELPAAQAASTALPYPDEYEE